MTMQTKERNVIGIIRQRLDPIEYRPHVQHKLHIDDDTFDLKFSALLWCQSLLHELKRKTFDKFAEKAMKQLLDVARSIPKQLMETRFVGVSYLRSCLSPPDLEFIIGRVEYQITTSSLSLCNRVLLYHISSIRITSCHQLLVELAEDIIRQNPVLDFVRKVHHNVLNDQMKVFNPVAYISQILSLYDEGHLLDEEELKKESLPFLFIIIPLFEQLANPILIELVQILQSLPCRSVILLAGSQLIVPSIFYDETFQGSTCLSRFDMCSSWELYDQFAVDVFPTSKLPVHFPPSILRSIHQDFTNTNQCVTTIIERLMSYLENHFVHRKALLCMTHQREWLAMMNVIKKPSRHCSNMTYMDESLIHESVTPALTALLALLDTSDIEGSKLKLSPTEDVRRTSEVEIALEAINSYNRGRILNRIIFNLLVPLRDALCAANHRARFRDALLWTMLLDSDINPRAVRDLQITICDQLNICSAKAVQLATVEWQRAAEFSATTKLIEQIDCPSMKEWLREKVIGAIREIANTFTLVDAICEYEQSILSMSYKTMESITNEDSSFEMAKTVEVQVAVGQSACDGETEEEMNFKQEHIENIETKRTILLNNLYIYEEMLRDFSDAIRNLLEQYLTYPKHADGLQGIMYISSEDEIKAHDIVTSGCNLRKHFMLGLLRPEKFLSKNFPSFKKKTIHEISDSSHLEAYALPDVALLAGRIRYAQPTEATHSWFQEFEPKATQHQWSVNKIVGTSSKRRKIGDEGDKEVDLRAETIVAMTKFRFVSSLYDIEKSGIVAAKRVDRGDVVISKQIYTGIS